MRNDLSLRSYNSPIIWVVLALAFIALFRGGSELFLSNRLNSLIHEQNADEQYTSRLVDLSSEATDAETGQRGYLITGNAAYLRPYDAALSKINSDLIFLNHSNVSNLYKSRIKEINVLTSAKLSELKSTLNTYQTGGQAAAYSIVNTGEGQTLMNNLKANINYVLNKQYSALSAKQNSTKDLSNLISLASPIGLIINLVLIYSVLYLARQAILKERRLEGTKEQFVTLASHQLRTPATAVKQYLYLLLDGYYGHTSKEQREVLRLIDVSNERGIAVANSLLSITRADAGEINISEEPVNLNELVLEVVNHYKLPIKRSKNQQIITKLPKRTAKAYIDPFYVRMILDNLIDNASKYSSEGKRIYVTLKSSKDHIEFSIKDQGIGIKLDDQPKLFKKFARLNSSLKVSSDGSGLGLYLVKKLIDLHGGTIEVASKPNKGSTFTVDLPRGE